MNGIQFFSCRRSLGRICLYSPSSDDTTCSHQPSGVNSRTVEIIHTLSFHSNNRLSSNPRTNSYFGSGMIAGGYTIKDDTTVPAGDRRTIQLRVRIIEVSSTAASPVRETY